MSLRMLLGMFAPGPPDQQNNSIQDMYTYIQFDFQTPAKFHIGMLSISLIIGLALGGLIAYTFWMEKRPVLSYITALVIALVCRTFFSILFDGVVLLGSVANVGGGNTLLSFQQICINLVLAFWLTLTIYLHARVQRNFNSEPTLNLYRYGIPGAAVFFAFIWIFLLQSEYPLLLWWACIQPLTQWVVNGFNLLSLLIQLALVADIVRMTMKISLDNDSISYLRKVAVLMGVLVFLFWLHLGLFIGWVPMKNSSSYTYFFYFINGLECAFVCPLLYFFNSWVEKLLYLNSRELSLETSVKTTASNTAELLAGSGRRGITTVDSVFTIDETGRGEDAKEEGTRDVVYSNVVEPQRLKNILDLYKRLNKIPSHDVVDGEVQNDWKQSKVKRSISDESTQRVSGERRCSHKSNKMCDHIQKKNAFYSSKYLILDAKGEKYFDTRPSISSASGRDSPMGDRLSKDYSPDADPLKKKDLVRKWLGDNSENMLKRDSLKQEMHEGDGISRKASLAGRANSQELTPDSEKRVSVTKKIISSLDSILRTPLSGKDDRKLSTKGNRNSLPAERSHFSPEPVQQIKSEGTDTPHDTVVLTQRELPVLDEKFPTETVTEQKRTPWQQDGGLRHYPTYYELQEIRQTKEQQEEKRNSIFYEKFSSLVNYLFSDNRQRADLMGAEPQHSVTVGNLEYQSGKIQMKSDYEEQIDKTHQGKLTAEEEPPGKKRKSVSLDSEFSDVQHPQELGVGIKETPVLSDGREHPEDEASLEHKKIESETEFAEYKEHKEMKSETEFEERISRSAKPAKPITEEEQKSIYTDSEFSDVQQAPDLGVSLKETPGDKREHSEDERSLEYKEIESGTEFGEQMSRSAQRPAKPITEEEQKSICTDSEFSDVQDAQDLEISLKETPGDKREHSEDERSLEYKEIESGTEFEEQMGRAAQRPAKPILPLRKKRKSVTSESEFSDVQCPQEVGVALKEMPVLLDFRREHPDDEGSLEYKKMKSGTEFEEQMGVPSRREAIRITQKEPLREKSQSISSESEFSIEEGCNKKIQQTQAVARKKPVAPAFRQETKSLAIVSDDQSTSSEGRRDSSTSEASFSLDTYYQQVTSAREKFSKSPAKI